MIHKNRFLGIIFMICIFNLSASEEVTKEVYPEVVLELEKKQLEQLLKDIDLEKFIEAVIRGMKEGIKEAREEAAVEASKVAAEEKIKGSKAFWEAVGKLNPIIWTLISLYAVKTIISALNR